MNNQHNNLIFHRCDIQQVDTLPVKMPKSKDTISSSGSESGSASSEVKEIDFFASINDIRED